MLGNVILYQSGDVVCALDKEQDVRTSEGGEQKRPLLPMKGGAGDDNDNDDGDDDGDDNENGDDDDDVMTSATFHSNAPPPRN